MDRTNWKTVALGIRDGIELREGLTATIPMKVYLAVGKRKGWNRPVKLWRKFFLTLKSVTEDEDEQRSLLAALFDHPRLTSRTEIRVSEAIAFIKLMERSENGSLVGYLRDLVEGDTHA